MLDGELKLQAMLSFLSQHQEDVFGFVEHGTCQDLVPPK